MQLLIRLVDHNVGADPGEDFDPEEIVQRVDSWSVSEIAPSVLPDDLIAIDSDTQIVGGMSAFVESFNNYYWDPEAGEDGYIQELPTAARETPEGETRDLSEDERLDERDEDLKPALIRANKRTIFSNI